MKIYNMVIYFKKFSRIPGQIVKATTDLISTIIISFGCSQTSYKWNHRVCVLGCLFFNVYLFIRLHQVLVAAAGILITACGILRGM